MSDPAFCYWSVADGAYAEMFKTTLRSARAVGVREDFHVWTDRDIPGATAHDSGQYDKRLYLFKFEFLKKSAALLEYDYFVFLDADNYFVRHPGDVLAALHGAPVHVVLESDCARETNTRADWWGCPLPKFVSLMRIQGVRSRAVYNTNAGFWIVHREAVEHLVQLAMEFWNFCAAAGYEFTEEAPLAYAGQMLCGNPYVHTLESRPHLWASDWTGLYADRLPDGRPWHFVDYMDGHPVLVDPAIVHCMRSKAALMRAAAAGSGQ